jgi:hypothetical protein
MTVLRDLINNWRECAVNGDSLTSRAFRFCADDLEKYCDVADIGASLRTQLDTEHAIARQIISGTVVNSEILAALRTYAEEKRIDIIEDVLVKLDLVSADLTDLLEKEYDNHDHDH